MTFMETIIRNGRLISDGFCAFVDVLCLYFIVEYSGSAVFSFSQLHFVRTTHVACDVRRRRCKHVFYEHFL